MSNTHDRLVASLTKRGAKPTTEIRTSKYTVLTRPGKLGHFYFVGPNGALRAGRTISTSISLGALRISLLRLDAPTTSKKKA